MKTEVPSFAVVGHPNQGKTTIMATLTEDDRVPISPVPGTTTHCIRYPVVIDSREILVFYDTPGFQSPLETLEWFQAHQTLPDPLQAFLDTFRHTPKFQPELEILAPLAEGAAAMFVADASRPVREADRQEVEILRLANVPRIGLINIKEGGSEDLADWKKFMRRDFNHVHEFNGHRATFQDRIRLLEAARAAVQEWDRPMEASIRALRDNWRHRLSDVARLIVRDLRYFTGLKIDRVIQHPGDEARAAEQAKEALMEEVRLREGHFREALRPIFKHSKEKWEMDTLANQDILSQDLFSEDVWNFLGLKMQHLIAAGAVIGATAGGIIDLHTGGLSLGAGILLGGGIGAALAWLSVDKAVDVKLPGMRLGPFTWDGGKVGGRQAEASIEPRSNLLWILLDRYLLYFQQCASWAHGLREKEIVAIDPEALKRGPTSQWNREQRDKVADFIGHLRRNWPNQSKLERSERELLEWVMRELERLSL